MEKGPLTRFMQNVTLFQTSIFLKLFHRILENGLEIHRLMSNSKNHISLQDHQKCLRKIWINLRVEC